MEIKRSKRYFKVLEIMITGKTVTYYFKRDKDLERSLARFKRNSSSYEVGKDTMVVWD